MQVPEAIPGGIEYEVIRKILNLENWMQVPIPLPGFLVYRQNTRLSTGSNGFDSRKGRHLLI